MTKYIFFILFAMIILGCKQRDPKDNPSQINKPAVEFNTSDKSTASNGNVEVAFLKYQQMANTLQPPAEHIEVEDLTKSPYSNLGKMVLVKGQVYKVEELPPDQNLPGKTYEVLMLAKNENSALGATTIDCVCVGNVVAKSGQQATCGGFFVGTYETQNAMGGAVEALAIVGNVVDKKIH